MRFLLLCALLCASLTAAADPPGYHSPRRYYTPAGYPYRRLPLRLNIGLNTAYYNGDVASSYGDNTFRLGVGAGLAKTLSPHLTFALDLTYFRLQATDVFPSRGYAFTSNNALLTGLLRYNLFADKSMFMGPRFKEMPVLLFASVGVGLLLNSPQATQYGIAIAPEPGNSYPALVAALPLGGGVTLRASQRFAFTAEALYYFTSTDMLDDVSQRGNPKSLDDFATITFRVEYSLLKGHRKPLVHFD